jgi:excisionase family DNA binding protein
MQEEKLLDVQHVAARLDLNPRTILRMVERGELRAFKVGHRLRFRPADLERYLHTHLSTNASTPIDDSYHSTPTHIQQFTPDDLFDTEEDSVFDTPAQTGTALKEHALMPGNQSTRRSKQAVQFELEKQKLEIEQKKLELQKQWLELHTRRIDHAIESATRAVNMLNTLPPEVDPHTKTMFLKSLLPSILQPEPHPAPGLTMMMPQINGAKEDREHSVQ